MMNKEGVRIPSIDLLRGVVMIIMVLDHARDYFHADAFLYDPLDLSRASAGLFFTRWITHFCAPVFVFLAGTSAYLVGRRKGASELSFFLLTRGLWLIVLELTVVNFGWFFNLRFPFIALQVIWAIGVSMLALSLMVRLPFKVILITGLVLVFGHNLLDSVHFPGTGIGSFLWALLHDQSYFPLGGDRGVFVAYPLLPWVGTMALGYCLGAIYTDAFPAMRRQRLLIALGIGALVLFVVIRLINAYGDPVPWSEQRTPLYTFLSFLNTTKYPPSLLYLLMTLGPSLLFLAFSEKQPSALAQKAIVFGRVPLFYYVMHIFVLHFIATIGAVMTGHSVWTMIFDTWVTMSQELTGYGFGLPVVYLVWIGVVVVLYPVSRWYERYKTANRKKIWLSYV
ncbi:MAG TPA: heparan-alpha-glucosaminide N-acetyltransferase domain-containing protein [Cyclobacteriaceae bacterium]|nr:heparan-alpha-glucosaminide N-acetyltransferase domain-containing protein [Cyclobacteriaceae bacterium]